MSDGSLHTIGALQAGSKCICLSYNLQLIVQSRGHTCAVNVVDCNWSEVVRYCGGELENVVHFFFVVLREQAIDSS